MREERLSHRPISCHHVSLSVFVAVTIGTTGESQYGCFLGTMAKKTVRFLVDMSALCVGLLEFGRAERDEVWDSDSSRSGHPGTGERRCLWKLAG